MLRSLSSLLLCLAPLAAQVDSSVADTLRQASWKHREVAVGVTWRQARFASLLGGPQQVSVLRIARREPSLEVSFAAPATGLARTSALTTPTTVAAVNGGFFSKDGTSEGLLRIDGKPGRHNQRRGSVMLGVAGDDVTICDTPDDGAAGFRHALAAGPWLVRDGKLAPDPDGPRHPRTAAGSNAREVVFATVDGRAEEAAGMTMRELAELMLALGCDTAFNLDGGGSTTMWVKAEGGVVNCPCDDKRFDAAGERAVANAVLVHGRAIWTLDEEVAALTPADAWQVLRDPAAIDGDCVEAARGGRAVFKLNAPLGGDYDVEVVAQKGARMTWQIGDRSGAVVAKRDGFCVIGEFSLTANGAVELQLGSDAKLRIDAVRLVEASR